ncbi:hypothetical protein [Streptomyces sp. NPDC058625]|uniref:hypothetical protein n=1 Tax=Streptomyces sp. NPDC058625 TaxID=3346564 RepID=UPI00365AB404
MSEQTTGERTGPDAGTARPRAGENVASAGGRPSSPGAAPCREAIAPDGAVLITPGGTLFVQQPSTPGGGWWCFEPGTVPRPRGAASVRPPRGRQP